MPNMPITKVPIVHKFGIISQSQRDELQERLLQQSVLRGTRTTHIPQSNRNPLELSETFIQQFNNAGSLEEKDKNEDTAFKLLSRIKRKAGLKDGGKGSHVDMPRAWSELSMLAQCRGKVQEECLDALIVSLHQAAFSVDHIPSLFYLAETTLYWLRTDAMDQPFLRIGEIKLLKMGQAVFLRLFYHHMAGHIQGRSDFKNRLLTYLSGFAENEEAYSPYPGAHLCLRLISSIGKMIVGEVVMSELKRLPEEMSKEAGPPEHWPDYLSPSNNKQSYLLSSPPDSLANPVQRPTSTPITAAVRKLQQHQQQEQQPQGRPDTYTSSIHDLSPSLWHALDVWRCTVHLGSGFPDAVKALALCGTTLGSEHWVDAVCALRVISEAAKGNMKVLKTLQNLAKGVVPSASPPVASTPHPNSASAATLSRFEGSTREEDILGDIAESEDGSEISLKESLTDDQSVELKLNEMMDSKMEICSDSKMKKFSLDWDLSLGPKQLSNLSGSSLLKSTSLRNTSVAVLIDSPQDKRAESLSDCSTALKASGSSRGMSEVVSRESQLDSAGALLGTGFYSRSPVMEEDEDKLDSDLEPGDESEVEIRNVDVTRVGITPRSAMPIREGSTGLKMKREVSFDIDIVSQDVVGEGSLTQDALSHKTQSRQGTSTIKLSSAQSVTGDAEPERVRGTVTAGKQILTSNRFPAHMVTELDGINGWQWEVAFVYTELMSHLCLHGNTANIQKRALVGDRKPDYRSIPVKTAQKLHGLDSAGLVDMAEYETVAQDESDVSDKDWAWRVRYAAILGLVKICRCCEGDMTKEGLRTVAWNFLMIRHSKERDDRVMEAFRVGQVDAHLESQMQQSPGRYSLNARLAAGLATTYLPPLAPVVERPRRPAPNKVELPKPTEPLRKGANRLSLRQEIQLSTALQDFGPQVSFNTRTSMDLRRIVEDQWRKELQEQLEEDEKDKVEYLEEEQALVEKRQREVAKNKAGKFNKL